MVTVPISGMQTIPAADDGDDHGEAKSHVGLVETAHILRRRQADQSDGRRVRAGGDRLGNTLRASDG